MSINYNFNLPSEENVIARNRTITTYYAQLYQRKPTLYKWAGMAAFASFHIGKKLQMWNWKVSGIKTLSVTCKKTNRSLEDDFQVIRIINNKIFTEIGWAHLAFSQMDFETFKSILQERGKNEIIITAFERLHFAREELNNNVFSETSNTLVWQANIDLLWHEQSEVVQPLFDKLSNLFAGAMSLFASFDYKINHNKTGWQTSSRFFIFMIFKGFRFIKKNGFIPEVTDLEHRWFWISNDLLVKWRKIESDQKLITSEIKILSQIEKRNLII
ncbi:DUF2515 family protein [Kordia sp.]|uniref:DUF2515 family protein n=1 Tax=Kordia sp. TaxID=1965332 RepID=UPI003D26DF67